jgi:hypothetical protein
MSWEDEEDWDGPAQPVAAAVAGDRWDGEDEDEGILGDDWDADEDAEKPAAQTVRPGEKKLTKRQLAKLREQKEKEARAEREREENLSPEEQAKKKEMERKRIEKEDLKLSSDLFGDMGDLSIDVNPYGEADADNVDMAAELDADVVEELKEKEPAGIEDYKLKYKDDFKKFATQVGQHVVGQIKPTMKGESLKLVEFMKIMLNEVMGPCSIDDANDLKKHFNKIYNEKAKDPAKKKKAGKSKPVVKKAGSAYDDYSAYNDDDMYGDYY